jgi:protein required for attachment to host cells
VLSQGLLWKRYSKLVLVAPAGVLDKLHATLTDEVADVVLATVERDMVEVPLRELPDLLNGEVRPRVPAEPRVHV